MTKPDACKKCGNKVLHLEEAVDLAEARHALMENWHCLVCGYRDWVQRAPDIRHRAIK